MDKHLSQKQALQEIRKARLHLGYASSIIISIESPLRKSLAYRMAVLDQSLCELNKDICAPSGPPK